MITDLKITNSKGDHLALGRSNVLLRDIDFSGLRAAINRFESNASGSRYQNTRIEEREFDIEFAIIRKNNAGLLITDRRIDLYKVLNPNLNPLRLDFKLNNGNNYYIMAELASAPLMPVGNDNRNDSWQRVLLQFIATDPFIYSANEIMTDIAVWIGTFEFPLEIPEEGIEMGYRSESLIANVHNDGQEKTGMKIRFRALGTVVNPSLINVNTYEKFKLDFTMQGGDRVEVITYRGRRSITLIRNNEKTNIFNSLDFETSTFLQLHVGDNLFRYDADDGLDNLEVSITHTPRLIGV